MTMTQKQPKQQRFVIRRTIHGNVYKIKDTQLGYAVETIVGLHRAKARMAQLNQQVGESEA